MSPARLRQYEALLLDDAFAAFLEARGLFIAERGPPPVEPHSDLMEQAALGAILMLGDEPVTPGMLGACSTNGVHANGGSPNGGSPNGGSNGVKLHVAHFYRETHRLIFRAVVRVEQRRKAGGEPDLKSIDLVVVAEELRRAGQLEQVGGVAYLTALIESCPSAANIDFYIKKVIECARLRYLAALGERLHRAALSPGDARGRCPDARFLLTTTRTALDAIEHHARANIEF